VPRYAYLDASAIVKLVVAEQETSALEHALLTEDRVLSSRISATEVVRAARRGAPRKVLQHAEEVLESFVLMDVTPAILDRAARLEPAGLRTLDAIHLASAASLQISRLDFITYDLQLARAAEALGLRSLQPGRHKRTVGHR
jgi:hypothetical protein